MITCSFVFNYFSFFLHRGIQDNFKLPCFLAFDMQLKGIIGVFCLFFIHLFIYLFFNTKEHYCTSGNQAFIHMYKWF